MKINWLNGLDRLAIGFTGLVWAASLLFGLFVMSDNVDTLLEMAGFGIVITVICAAAYVIVRWALIGCFGRPEGNLPSTRLVEVLDEVRSWATLPVLAWVWIVLFIFGLVNDSQITTNVAAGLAIVWAIAYVKTHSNMQKVADKAALEGRSKLGYTDND